MADIELNRFLKNNDIYKILIMKPLQNANGEAMSIAEAGYKATRPVIRAFLTNPMNWSASNTWEGLHQGLQAEKDQESNIKKFETVAAQTGFKKGGMSAVMGITETIARYAGSQKPTFGFNIMLVSLNPTDNIISDAMDLLKGCYPKSAKMGLLEAPYGYLSGWTGGNDNTEEDQDDGTKTAPLSSAKGTWDIQVGRWFRCPNLVMNSCNLNFSQQCVPTGQPLYIEAQLVFEAWRLITAAEVNSYFNTSMMYINS